MWMLAINKRGSAIGRFAGLKQQRVPGFADGRRFEREHAAQAESAGAKRMLSHSHEHVWTEKFAVSPIPALVIVNGISKAVNHEHPIIVHVVKPLHGGGFRLPGRA